MKCPTCSATDRQHKAGFNGKPGANGSGANGSRTQRYECQHCHRTYTPQPKSHGYSQETRHKALQMYVDGLNFRRIARLLDVHHQTVINWVNHSWGQRRCRQTAQPCYGLRAAASPSFRDARTG